jgi:hypothetical protein
MTSSLPPAVAPVIEPIGVGEAFSTAGERVRVIDNGGPTSAGEFITACGANVLLPARVLKPVSARRGRATAPREAVGLKDFRDKNPQEPSGRTRQLVAKPALVHDQPTLPMDEPCVEEIAVAMLRPRHLEVNDGGAFGNHVRGTINAFDARAVAAAARSAGLREDWR